MSQDWADEIAKEIDMDWPSVTAALRKARNDALEEVLSPVIEAMEEANKARARGIYTDWTQMIDELRALKEKQP
jgi:hypothetical protein